VTRFNFAEALAEQREQDRRSHSQRAMFDDTTERVVLSAILADDAIEDRVPCEPHRVSPYALVDDLEVDDFANPRHRAAFTAWRNLQFTNVKNSGQDALPLAEQTARLEQIWLYDVFEEFVRGVVLRGTNPIDAAWFLPWLFDLATAPWPWGPVYQPRVTVSWLAGSLNRLRSLAQIRRLV
jgi:hypothetical protein